jgi:cytochrome c2
MQLLCLALLALFLTMGGVRAEDIQPDAARGALLFSTRCSVCHATDVNKYGPLMHAVVGRKAGDVSGFLYSDALRSSKIVWTTDTLDKYLEDPVTTVAGTRMNFKVSAPQDRADIIAYLKRLSVPLADPRQPMQQVVKP